LLRLARSSKKLALRKASDSFLQFCQIMDLEPPPAKHHRLIIRKLEAVERGELKRLMIFTPPGYAKSTYASVLFPPWFLGRNTRKKIVTGSYNTDLSDYFGRKARNVVNSDQFFNIFGISLDPELGKAIGEWGLTHSGEYYGTGVGAGVTGRRGDLLLLDDPIKGRKEADSLLIRNTTWEWYLSDLRSRMKPDAAIVIINTRWHEDDLCGRILTDKYKSGSGWFQAYDGEKWYVLSLPALAEKNDVMGRKEGEALWPSYYTLEMVEQEKKSQDERNWSALWQCRPSPEEGDYFKREWLRFYDKPPEHLKHYGASDYAVTADGGDYTEHGIFGLDPNDDLYILDWWFGQTDTNVWINTQIELARKWRPVYWANEKGQIEKSVGPFISKRMQETGAYFYQKKIAAKHDKATRAQAIRGRFSQGKVYLPSPSSPRHGPWVERLINQMLTFPAGINDDGVDVLSLIGLSLVTLQKGTTPQPPAPRLPNPYTFDEITKSEPPYVSPYRL